jgi:PII-like signaling protein
MEFIIIDKEELDGIKKDIQDLRGLLGLSNTRYIGIQTALKLKEPDVVEIGDTANTIKNFRDNLTTVSNRVYAVELKTGIAKEIEPLIKP